MARSPSLPTGEFYNQSHGEPARVDCRHRLPHTGTQAGTQKMKRLLERLRRDPGRTQDSTHAPVQAVDRLRQELAVAQAVEAERRCIHDDLHDDVGSKLLSLLHQLDDPAQQQAVREILQDLRDILARSRNAAGSLLELLAQLRDESERRLETRGITLEWLQPADLPDPTLDAGQRMHLARIGRESITNALRHAAPNTLRVRIGTVGNDLIFEVTDDGTFSPARIGHGQGTRSMRHRADALKGDIHWKPGTQGGTKVILRFPLPTTPPYPRDAAPGDNHAT